MAGERKTCKQMKGGKRDERNREKRQRERHGSSEEGEVRNILNKAAICAFKEDIINGDGRSLKNFCKETLVPPSPPISFYLYSTSLIFLSPLVFPTYLQYSSNCVKIILFQVDLLAY